LTKLGINVVFQSCSSNFSWSGLECGQAHETKRFNTRLNIWTTKSVCLSPLSLIFLRCISHGLFMNYSTFFANHNHYELFIHVEEKMRRKSFTYSEYCWSYKIIVLVLFAPFHILCHLRISLNPGYQAGKTLENSFLDWLSMVLTDFFIAFVSSLPWFSSICPWSASGFYRITLNSNQHWKLKHH
jgi:hypothetical protein